MNCIIVDDEPIAREGMIRLLADFKQCKIIASCKNVLELEQAILMQLPDVIFLDIEMPYTNGMNYLRNEEYKIPTIITTAYQQYATESYELNVVDYLIKPITKQRFEKCMQKLTDYLSYLQFSKSQENYIFLKIERQLEKIYFADILYIEAMRNYVVIITTNGKIIHYSSITGLEEKLPNNQFVRVHKSYIINLEKVSNYSSSKIIINNIEIPLSKQLKISVFEKLENKQ